MYHKHAILIQISHYKIYFGMY